VASITMVNATNFNFKSKGKIFNMEILDTSSKEKIAVVGLGYVGLPLAIKFAKHFKVIGFDIDEERIESLKKGYDIEKASKPLNDRWLLKLNTYNWYDIFDYISDRIL